MNEEQFRELKSKVEEARTEYERARGALEQLLKQMEEEFDCHSLKEAKSLLAEIQRKRDVAEKTLNKAMKDYERKWKNVQTAD